MAKQNSGEAEVKEVKVVEEVEAEKEVEAKFTVRQLTGSKKYSNNKDVLSALLTEGESYTHAEISKLMEDFMKGEIK